MNVKAVKALSWAALRQLAVDADKEDEFDLYQALLPAQLMTALVDATSTRDRYIQDALFRERVNQVVTIIMEVLLQRKEHTPQTYDMDALTKIFKEEAGLDG